MSVNKPEPLLWLDDHRGQYIPRDFALSFGTRDQDVTGVSAEDWAILEAGPDHEYYWETWDDVCNRAIITNNAEGENGTRYFVHQDGACWLIPLGMVRDETCEFFKWPDENGEDC